MWVGKTESVSFRMGVLTDLKARGVEDILLTVTDTVEYISDMLGLIAPEDGLVLTGSSTVIIGG